MTASVHILNGPNLNRLGKREPDKYGTATLADIETLCRTAGAELGFEIVFRQSNYEGELVGWIQEAGDQAQGLIINPAAYTHTSIAVHDAIRATDIPVIELHLSNVFAREEFRHHSYVSPVAHGVICGFGANGYKLALTALSDLVNS